MRKLICLLAIGCTAAVAAQEEEALRDAREKLADAQARLTEAAREMADATRHQFVARSDRAMLGVLIAEQGEEGVVVGGVTPDSGADAAGIVADDVITGINGEPLTGLAKPGERLVEILADVESGDPVTLVVLRDGELSEMDVVTSRYRPDVASRFDFDWWPRDAAAPIVALRSRFARSDGGLELVDIGEDLGDYFGVDAGVLVLDTPPKSELRPGDIIKRVDGADVASSEEARRLLAGEGDEAAVEVRRKNRALELTVARDEARPRGFMFRSSGGDVDEREVEIDVDGSN